jgi:hypothetical protein
VFLGFLFVPAKDFHEDVRDINHQVHRVIPANDVVIRGQIVIRLGFLLDDGPGQRDWFRDGWHTFIKAKYPCNGKDTSPQIRKCLNKINALIFACAFQPALIGVR